MKANETCKAYPSTSLPLLLKMFPYWMEFYLEEMVASAFDGVIVEHQPADKSRSLKPKFC